jgi:hypothetical protein
MIELDIGIRVAVIQGWTEALARITILALVILANAE